MSQPRRALISSGLKRIPIDRAGTRQSEPNDISAAEKELNGTAKRVNVVWIAFLLQCVYIFIATLTVTPAALFRDATVRLPIFNADLPLKSYFILAPALVLTTHLYLMVLTKRLSERIEDVLRRPNVPPKRRAVAVRLHHSIVLGSLSGRYRETYGSVAPANGLIAGLTMAVLPTVLLLFTQLIFLPYQDEDWTWLHRGFVFVDITCGLWLLAALSASPVFVIGRILVVLLFAATSLLAAFPGERVYDLFEPHWPHAFTQWLFEGPPDPVDYIRKGGVVRFPNRLIVPDDPKLAVVPGAPTDGVSVSVRGRNFRMAVFDRSNLARVDFSAADLEGASLRGARLEGARFECAGAGIVTFEGPAGAYDSTFNPDGNYVCANLGNANLAFASLDRSSFKGADLRGSSLVTTAITGADFSNATLYGATFNGAVGQATKFINARLVAADFRRAQLFAADFEGARLQGASLSLSYLQAGNFRGASMQGIDASGAFLQGATLDRAYLQAAKFVGAAMEAASLKGAALEKASFMCAKLFRTDFENADRRLSIANDQTCETGWYEAEAAYSIDVPIDAYQLPTDTLPKPDSQNYFEPYRWGYDAGYTVYAPMGIAFRRPEKLDDETLTAAINQATSDLPADTKMRVTIAFERLRPNARTKAQDDADKAFRADWVKESASLESHGDALATRLESIACIAEGAPFVASGLLLAKRFDGIYASKNASERAQMRIVERLKRAASGGDSGCLGAIGLVDSDFGRLANVPP